MTCDVCRGDAGPYRRCADPHQCNARLEGQRDALEAVLAGTLKRIDEAYRESPTAEGRAEADGIGAEVYRLCAEHKVEPTPK